MADSEDFDETSGGEDLEIEELEIEQPKITPFDAYRHFQISRQYIEENESNSIILRHSDALDDYFYAECSKKQTQPKITNYFSSKIWTLFVEMKCYYYLK